MKNLIIVTPLLTAFFISTLFGLFVTPLIDEPYNIIVGLFIGILLGAIGANISIYLYYKTRD